MDSYMEGMLSALTVDKSLDLDEFTVDKNIQKAEMIKILRSKIVNLSIQDKTDMIRLLLLHNLHDDIKDCATGVLINADKLDDNIVKQLFDLLSHKSNSRKNTN